MRQNYYCPNCGAPVVCGANFCTGCGVNFHWIAKSDLEQCSPSSYRLPSSSPQGASVQQQSLPDKAPESTAQLEFNHGSAQDEGSTLFKGQETPLKAEVSKLLESLFDKRIKCPRV